MTEKLFPTIEDLAKSGFLFRIQDSGPGTIDRITVVFCDGDYLALSLTGGGFSMWGEGLDPLVMAEKAESKEVVDLALGDLTPELQNNILYRVNEAFEDALQGGGRLDPKYVAQGREKAAIHYGLFSDAGDGIYRNSEGQFSVRMEGSGMEDRGPYATYREALLMTLPEDYSLCGPEYHPSIDVASLVPTPGAAEAIAALEAGEAA
jgi:hypothetical protein